MSDREGIWVQSSPTPDGHYRVELTVGSDRAWAIDGPAAFAYARELLRVTHAADHDAAVVRLLQRLGIPLKAAAVQLELLRADRPPVDDAATAPLRFRPIVAARDQRGVVQIELDGRLIGQWEVVDALSHALAVLETWATVDLDAALLRSLRSQVGLEEPAARAFVDDLGSYRELGGDVMEARGLGDS